jgi:hypothetical protein
VPQDKKSVVKRRFLERETVLSVAPKSAWETLYASVRPAFGPVGRVEHTSLLRER